jgi:hypothetical protein
MIDAEQIETFFESVGAFGYYPTWAEDEARSEAAAEAAAERYFEEGTEGQREQYRWEVEQDERRAAFWGATV